MRLISPVSNYEVQEILTNIIKMLTCIPMILKSHMITWVINFLDLTCPNIHFY